MSPPAECGGESPLVSTTSYAETGVEARRSLGFTLQDMGVADPDYADVTPELGLYFIHYYFPDP